MPDEPVQEQELDAAKFISERNAAAAARLAGKEPPPLPAEVKKAEAPTEETDKRIQNRRDRRTQFRLREEIGFLKGENAALKAMGAKPSPSEPVEQVSEDPEPQRKDFSTDAEYNRAVGRWDSRQETAKALAVKEKEATAKSDSEKWFEHVREMDLKASEDIKLIEDWKEVAKEAEKLSDEDASLRFPASERKHDTFRALLAQSDVRAFMAHHYAKNPDDLRKILAMTPTQQINAFNRLEGKVEVMYTSKQKQEVVQASDKGKLESKERTLHPAEVDKTTGRNASQRDAEKPRPASDVSARGGSPPPEEPEVGSKAWMERRNAMQYGHRS